MYLLTDALHRAERLFGDHEAAAMHDRRLTYNELADRCRRLAGLLAGMGVGRGDRVAILAANGPDYLAAYFAVPGMGAVLVPMNNRLAVAEHRYCLADAGVTVLIADAAHAEVAAQLADGVGEVLLLDGRYDQRLAAATPLPLGSDPSGTPVDPEDLAGLFYTGGTTGAAKGVMLSHRNLMANALNIAVEVGYQQSDCYLHAAPMFHLADGASTYALTWIGGRHTFLPSFEPAGTLATIARERVTVTVLVPAMITLLVSHPDVTTTDLSSLRLVLHGGAPISPDLCRRAIAALGCSFMQAYGMTEAAPVVTTLSGEEGLLDSPRITSAGRPVLGVQTYVARPDGSECAVGEVGEVVVRGPNVMQGYWNKPEETAEVLVDGWYWTRDMAVADAEGYLFIVDRSKDMIISGGENVYSIEVENAIASHPAVLECAVIGVPDERWGEGVHAVAVLQPGAELALEALQDHCRTLIAGYKLPRSLDLLDALPRSGAGKVIKADLRRPYWQGQHRNVS